MGLGDVERRQADENGAHGSAHVGCVRREVPSALRIVLAVESDEARTQHGEALGCSVADLPRCDRCLLEVLVRHGMFATL
jgi:hypothetical protein